MRSDLRMYRILVVIVLTLGSISNALAQSVSLPPRSKRIPHAPKPIAIVRSRPRLHPVPAWLSRRAICSVNPINKRQLSVNEVW